ncbi:unnamed protein product [Umbelopsis ramanniana]
MRAFMLLAAATAVLIQLAETSLVTIPLHKRSSDTSFKNTDLNYDDGLLVGTALVGNPPQQFEILFDTGSGLTWVPSSECKSGNCKNHEGYKANQSSSSVNTGQTYKLSYGQGQCIDAKIYRDTVSVGGFTVIDQQFGAATRVSGFDTPSFLGVFGLGDFSTDGGYYLNSTGKPNTIGSQEIRRRQTAPGSASYASNAFMANNGYTSPQFGTYVTSAPTGFGKRWHTKGHFVFGGVDHTVYKGKIAYFPLVDSCDDQSSRFWKIPLSCVKFGDVDIKLHPNSNAAISTGTSFLSAPIKQADKIHDAINAQYDPSSNVYKIDCDKIDYLPDLVFTFSGYTVKLPSSQWTSRKGDQCNTLIRRSSSDKNWILGGAFSNSFYTIFDLGGERVGLAIPKDQCKAKIYKHGQSQED